ncbi:MAG: tetratricopeptide repeat protein [Proteobacteria bacterium]|nr:tetratricopeptide repeat protein [Pseudomonadota bacterium]
MRLFDSIFKALSPGRKKRKKRGRATHAGGGGFRPSGEDGRASAKVVVADLYGSGGGEFADRITGILTNEQTFLTYRLKKSIRQNIRLGLLERLLVAAEEAGNLLNEEKGDLLIWGEMEDMGTIGRMNFYSPVGGVDGQPGTFGLADSLDLPWPLPDGFGDIVRGVVLAAIGGVTEGAKTDIAASLKKHLPAIETAVSQLPADLNDENRAAILNCAGNAFATSIRFGDKGALPGAVKMYEMAGTFCSATASPVIWALVQTHWAAALEADGRQRKDPAGVEAAIQRYKAVADGLSKDINGYDWALAQVRRAMAIYKLAGMVPEKTAAYLKQAGSAFEEALTIYNRQTMPARWGEVMNHYGVVLMALGNYGESNETLEKSITTFKQALEIRKREIAPIPWAQTVNNLGAACFALGKRNKETYLLNEAAVCFEGAIGVYKFTRGQKKRTKVIAGNLEKVRRMLAGGGDADAGPERRKKKAAP